MFKGLQKKTSSWSRGGGVSVKKNKQHTRRLREEGARRNNTLTDEVSHKRRKKG